MIYKRIWVNFKSSSLIKEDRQWRLCTHYMILFKWHSKKGKNYSNRKYSEENRTKLLWPYG